MAVHGNSSIVFCATVFAIATIVFVIGISSRTLTLPHGTYIFKSSELENMKSEIYMLSSIQAQNNYKIDDLARKIGTLSRQLSAHSPLQTDGSMAIPQSDSTLQTRGSMSIPQPETFSFVDYSPEHWKLKKNIYKRQSLKQHGGGGHNGRHYFQNNWEPDFTCDFEERIGAIGDGGKWLCNAYKIAQVEECNVLSIGSLNDYGFEETMHKLNPRCKIHTFDHTVTPDGRKPPYVNFHKFGLGSQSSGNRRSMKDVIDMAGFKGKVIDVLKIDCEGCEFSVYKEFFTGFICQILIELHYMNVQSIDTLLQDMYDHGYSIFHKEPNTLGCDGECIEYAFLRTNFTDP